MSLLLTLGHLSRHLLSLGCQIEGIKTRSGYRIHYREVEKFLVTEELKEFSEKIRQIGCNCPGIVIRKKGKVLLFEFGKIENVEQYRAISWHIRGTDSVCIGNIVKKRQLINYFEFYFLQNPVHLIKLSYHLLLNGCSVNFLYFQSSRDIELDEMLSDGTGSEVVILETPSSIFVISEQTWFEGTVGAKYTDEWRVIAEAHRESLLEVFEPEGFDYTLASIHDSPRTYRLILEKRKKHWTESIR